MKSLKQFIAILVIIPFTMISPKGEKFRVPTLNEYTKNLILTVSVGTPDERIRAIQECGHGHYIICYYPLVEVLSDPNPEIRGAAASSLGLLGVEESLEHLTGALRAEKDLRAKESILWAFGLLRNKKGGSIVAEFLNDSEPKIRRAAAIALTMIRARDTKDAILEALKNESIEIIQIELIFAGLLVDPQNTDLAKQLIGNLFSKNRLVRLSAAKAARKLKIKETLVPLKKAILFEVDELVRTELLAAYQAVLYE